MVTSASTSATGGKQSARAARAATGNAPSPVTKVSDLKFDRIVTGIGELDRVLGGGFVQGGVVLLAGSPGSGKSTLTLEIAKKFTEQGKTALLISGEETEQQIASRAKRVGALSDSLYLLSENNLTNALSHAEAMHPDFLVIDSLQALASDVSESRIGSISQSIEVAHEATQLAKRLGIPAILIGQVNKSEEIAGSNQISHLVDCTLYLESSDDSPLRLLRSMKNRYGELEIGVFQHTEDGLEEVSDPSGFFLDGHEDGTVGYAASILLDGNRALPIEVQALVTTSALPNPRKISNGLDHGRVVMIQAILEKHAGLSLGNKDVYVSTTGGLLAKDSSIDLAIAAAIVSSYKNLALPEQSVFLGETSLTGEIRSPRSGRKRATEAQRLGFQHLFMPFAPKLPDTIETVSNIKQLLYKLQQPKS
jgi:DNA repair protein RadA/Sms